MAVERGALVVIQGSGYQTSLLEQLEQVQKDSEELIHQAEVSDITSTRETLKAIFEGTSFEHISTLHLLSNGCTVEFHII